MSLLSVCTEAAQTAGIDAPGSIVGNSEETAIRLLALAKKAGKSLHRRANWAILQKEHTFTTTALQAEYTLPSDFHRFLDDTAWDRDSYRRMRGPLSPQEWQIKKSGLGQTAQIDRNWRVKRASSGNTATFYIDPVPDASSVDLVFEYVSSQWCASTLGALQTDWTADADVALLDEYLLELELTWRFLNRLGLAYAEEKAEAEDEIDKAIARDGGAPTLHMAPVRFDIGRPTISDVGFGS